MPEQQKDALQRPLRLHKQHTYAVFLSVALCFFAVDLTENADGLTVTLLDLVHFDIRVLKFGDIDSVEALTAGESVLLDVFGLPAYAERAEVLTAVECPVSDRFDR